MDCLCCAPGTPCHWPRRSLDPKGPISLALGSAGVVGTAGGGMETRNEREGVGIFFYRRPVVLTSISLAFFKIMYSAHSPCGIKRPTISRF
jgi:hypothetical protein